MHHWKSGTHHQSGGHLCMLLSRENFFSDNRSWKRPFYRRWKNIFWILGGRRLEWQKWLCHRQLWSLLQSYCKRFQWKYAFWRSWRFVSGGRRHLVDRMTSSCFMDKNWIFPLHHKCEMGEMICYFNLFIQKYCLILWICMILGENDPVSYKTPTNFDICGCFSKKVLLIRPFDNIMSTALQKNGRSCECVRWN